MSTAHTDSGATVGTSSGSSATKDAAKEQAGQVGQHAKQSASEVAGTAKEQAGEVVSQAQTQARNLLSEAQSQVAEQAGTQRDRLVGAMRTLGDELEQMADHGGEPGLGAEVARQLSDRLRQVAGTIEHRDAGDLLQDVRSLAGRRPTAFLVGALALGVAAGRLTRGAKAAQSVQGSGNQPAGRPAPALETRTGTPLGSTAGTELGATGGIGALPPAGSVEESSRFATPDADVDLTTHGRSAVGERSPGAGPLATGDDIVSDTRSYR